MNTQGIIIGSLIFLIAHILVFFQLNGQFLWTFFRKNDWLMALIGVPISFLFIWATRYLVNGFEGLLWPTRFIGFGIGMVLYAILVSIFFNEGINIKTAVSLLLAVILIGVQVLWK